MTALCEQMVPGPKVAHRLPDQFLAREIALGCVNHVQPCVKRGGQQRGDNFRRGLLKPDFRAAESEDAHPHVGFAELSLFHLILLKSRETKVSGVNFLPE
jgi:hypothetical protein